MAISKDFLKGARWKQVVNYDIDIISQLDKDALKVAVNRLARQANKRLSIFKAANIDSPASVWAERSGGSFSTKGKSFNQLRAEFRRARDFLQAETSTLEGYRRVQGEVAEGLMKEGVTITPADYDKFWKAYEKLKKENSKIMEKSYKYKVLRHIAYLVQDRRTTAQSIANRLSDQLDAIYKERDYNDTGDYYGVSQFFNPIE